MPGPPIRNLRVNEIFYSIQGEGAWLGSPSVFIRFSGCNLRCTWCDTKYAKKVNAEMTADILVGEVAQMTDAQHVVLTGGEPTIQDPRAMTALVRALRKNTRFVQVETNGTKSEIWLADADWVTVSPKMARLPTMFVLDVAKEIKVVYDDQSVEFFKKYETKFGEKFLFLQPKSNMPEEVRKCVEIVKKRPVWRLSLQLHKMIGLR